MNAFTFINPSEIGNRSHYVGSSELATLALFNIGYGQTPLTMFMEKTGKKESFKGNERTDMGNELEALILKLALLRLDYRRDSITSWYLAKLKGLNKSSLRYSNYRLFNNTHFVHPDYKYNISHPDLIIDNSVFSVIIEAKSSGYFASKRVEKKSIRGFQRDGYDMTDFSENGIPDKVYLQVQDQLLLSGIDTAYVALLSDNRFYLYGEIKANPRVQEICMSLKANFWHCIETDTPPEPETWEDLKWINPTLDAEASTMISGDKLQTFAELKADYQKYIEKEKIIKEKIDDVKTAIGLMVGANKYLLSDEGKKLASISEIERESISLSDVKKHAELFQQLETLELIKTSSYRKLNISK